MGDVTRDIIYRVVPRHVDMVSLTVDIHYVPDMSENVGLAVIIPDADSVEKIAVRLCVSFADAGSSRN